MRRATRELTVGEASDYAVGSRDAQDILARPCPGRGGEEPPDLQLTAPNPGSLHGQEGRHQTRTLEG